MTEPNTTDETASLQALIIKANEAYARKKYEDAAEIFSQACELQDSINGEMAVENADLLYSYGRCLYHLGVSKSDVLGGKATAEGQQDLNKKRKRSATASNAAKASNVQDTGEQASNSLEKIAEEQAAQEAIEEHVKAPKPASKGFFELSGDAAEWEDSDEEADEANGEDEDEEEDDDFATAYEILDMARRLFEKTIGNSIEAAGKGKGKESQEPPQARQAKEKLADTHDLQSEISLENERFKDAIADGRASLAIKQQLYEPHSRLLAEAHFKVSLALEFASITTEKNADGENVEEAQVDEAMRAEAASEMQKAIECLKLHIKHLSEQIKAADGDEKQKKIRAEEEVTEMIAEMEVRLEDLRLPAESLRVDSSNLLGGMVDAASQAKAQDKAAQAQDISGLVKKKSGQTAAKPAEGQTKRKVQDDDAASSSSKKAKVDESADGA